MYNNGYKELERQASPEKINKKSPEEILGDFYDENDGMRLKGVVSDEDYAEFKKEYIERGIDDERINDDLEKKIFIARYDEVTRMERRGGMFNSLGKEMDLLFGLNSNEKLDDKEWLRMIKNQEIDERFDRVHVMMCDISYLSVANRSDHSEGDKLLKMISRVMGENIGTCYRYGGDEITAVIKGDKTEVLEKISKTKEAVSKIQDLDCLKNFNLTPNIDVGFASLAEGIGSYRKMLDRGVEKRKEIRDVKSNLQDMVLLIADKRASVNKAKERINLLLDRRSKNDLILNDLRKAAYDLSDDELDELENEILRSGKKEESINYFIRGKEIEAIEKKKSEYKRRLLAIILELLNI